MFSSTQVTTLLSLLAVLATASPVHERRDDSTAAAGEKQMTFTYKSVSYSTMPITNAPWAPCPTGFYIGEDVASATCASSGCEAYPYRSFGILKREPEAEAAMETATTATTTATYLCVTPQPTVITYTVPGTSTCNAPSSVVTYSSAYGGATITACAQRD